MRDQRERILKAMEEYGKEVVSTVVEIVSVSDPDGAYVHFEDYGMYEHAECVEYIYFED